jgi:hypothetical protein
MMPAPPRSPPRRSDEASALVPARLGALVRLMPRMKGPPRIALLSGGIHRSSPGAPAQITPRCQPCRTGAAHDRVIVYRSATAPSGLEREGLSLPTLLTVVAVAVAALIFYAWAVRRERKLRQLMLSDVTRAESKRAACRTKRATADVLDLLTGGVTLPR